MDKDVRGPGRDHESTSTNSCYELSWIWLIARVNISSNSGTNMAMGEEFNESMRVEWTKTRARKTCWAEELLILQEEMRQMISFFEWKAAWWWEQAYLRHEGDAGILSGVVGYANKQAAICECMVVKCAFHWLPELKMKGVMPSWGEKYEVLAGQEERNEDMESDENVDDIDIDDE